MRSSISSRRWATSLSVAALLLGAWFIGRALHRTLRPKEPATNAAAAPSERAPQDLPWELRVEPASSALAGTVRGADGTPIAGARVCASSEDAESVGAPRLACADTDPKGAYAIDSLAPGAYHVTAEAEGFVPGGPPTSGPTIIERDQSKTGVDIVL